MKREELLARSRQPQRKDYSTMHPSGQHRRRPVAPPTVWTTEPRVVPPNSAATPQAQHPAPQINSSPITTEKPTQTSIATAAPLAERLTPVSPPKSHHQTEVEHTFQRKHDRHQDEMVNDHTDSIASQQHTMNAGAHIKQPEYIPRSELSKKTAPKKQHFKKKLGHRTKALAQWHPRLQHSVVWMVAIGVLVMGGAGTAIWAATQASGGSNVLPAAVVDAASYTVYAPSTGVMPESADYDAARQMVSYKITSPAPVTVSMQAMPAQFQDVPGYADRFFNGLEPYKTFTSDIGKVHLTWRVDDKSADTAVVDGGDTLLFISSQKELSVDTWKEIITLMQAI